jgi:hypothetical protein
VSIPAAAGVRVDFDLESIEQFMMRKDRGRYSDQEKNYIHSQVRREGRTVKSVSQQFMIPEKSIYRILSENPGEV